MLAADGALYCTGSDAAGQLTGAATERCSQTDRLGTYSYPCSTTPVRVAQDYTFTDAATGLIHLCGIANGNSAVCWGDNSYGQLGTGTSELCDGRYGGSPCSRTPLRVAGGHTFTRVTAGVLFTCALTTAGAAHCWGKWTGLNASADMIGREPLSSGGTAFSTIVAGYDHVCAITAAGEPYCWGAMEHGQIGNGWLTYEATPSAVTGLTVSVRGP